MECFACDEDATRQCPRCGKPYCLDHGDGLCFDCLDPLSAVPSSAVFRTSLFALLAGLPATALAVRCGDARVDTACVVYPTICSRCFHMLLVTPREGESSEALINRFTKLVQRDGVLREFKRRRHFISKPQQRRLDAQKAARKRARRAAKAASRRPA